MKRKGVLTVVSGFSGAGKGTLMKRLLEKYDNFCLSVSATTRKPREGEQEGVSYFFKSTEEFCRMIKEDAFIEYARYVDNYYGTPREYVEQQLESGKDVILEIEIQGALNVKRKFPDTVLIFVTPPTVDELENRLTSRGTETADTVAARMAQARTESALMDAYDYLVVNETGEAEACVDRIYGIIESSHYRTAVCDELIGSLQEQFRDMGKEHDAI